MRIARIGILLDMLPLYEILVSHLGLASNRNVGGYGRRLAEIIKRLGMRPYTVCPVFTETLYFIIKDLKNRRDREEKQGEAKKTTPEYR